MIEFGMPTLIELPEVEDCARLCRELDLQFIELNMNLPQYQTDRLDLPRLRRTAEAYHIYYTVHLDENLNPCDFNPHVAEAYTRAALEAIDLARALDIPVLNMHLSRGVYFTLPEKKVFLFDEYRPQYLDGMRRFRDRCAAALAGTPIKLCLENSGGFTDFQIEALDLLLENPCFALTYDIGHNHSIGGGDEPAILQRRRRLTHFHIHDAVGKKNHLPLGTGEIDVEKHLALAEACGGRAVLEAKTAAGLRASVRWLRQRRLKFPHTR